jgi:hypothetical protein
MLRQPRLDAPGTLHHVMGRGIDRAKISIKWEFTMLVGGEENRLFRVRGSA